MILCIGAHPDDIELGAAGSISGNGHVYGICLTAHSAFKHLLPEMLESWDLLDIRYNENWNQGFKHRDLQRQQVLDTLIKLREELNPDIVLTHSSFDHHQDHKVIYEETVRAFKHTTILGYDLPWNNVTGGDFRYFQQLNIYDVNKKMNSLSCYKSQKERQYFDKDYQKALLLNNGLQCGTDWAERFELIRCIEKL